MQTHEILAGRRYVNSKGMVCEVLKVRGGTSGPDDLFSPEHVIFKILKAPKGIAKYEIGRESVVTARTFSLWADAKLDSAGRRIRPRLSAKTEAPSAKTMEVVVPNHSKKPSVRTFYLTESGLITKEKPEHFVRTARAQNAAHAHALLSGKSEVPSQADSKAALDDCPSVVANEAIRPVDHRLSTHGVPSIWTFYVAGAGRVPRAGREERGVSGRSARGGRPPFAQVAVNL